MEKDLQYLKLQLTKCSEIIRNVFEDTKIGDLGRLNNFCAEFLAFAKVLHTFIGDNIELCAIDGNDDVLVALTMLPQVATCVRHLEQTVKAESSAARMIPNARQHFLSRIYLCLNRLPTVMDAISKNFQSFQHRPLHTQNFVELMDMLKDRLAPFSRFKDGTFVSTSSLLEATNRDEMTKAALLASTECRSFVDVILVQVLAFANVALKKDKKVLSGLCQKILYACSAFQTESGFNFEKFLINKTIRKRKAKCLEQALHKLEAYVTDALLRLIFTCFGDFERYSVEKLRNTMSNSPALDNSFVDELIADFDVNMDRCNQICILGMAFATDLKDKITLRSCLSSFEVLEICLISDLRSSDDLHCDLLEQHFKAEIASLKNALHKVIESKAVVRCYLDMLIICIDRMSKRYKKTELQTMAEMAVFIQEHFEVNINTQLLDETEYHLGTKYFNQFKAMLGECRAILNCVEQVDTNRILYRFKIMANILNKLHTTIENLNNSVRNEKLSDQKVMNSEEISDDTGESINSNEGISGNQQQECSAIDSLAANNSNSNANDDIPSTSQQTKNSETSGNRRYMVPLSAAKQRNIRRKGSMRTTMFKRQNLSESEQLNNNCKNREDRLQISAILDELSNLSSTLNVNDPT